MRDIVFASIVYVSFFSLIGAAVWFTGSAWCLWALVLTPGVKITEEEVDE